MSARDGNELAALEILKRLVKHESKNSLFDEYSRDGEDGFDIWESTTLSDIIEDAKKIVYGKEYPAKRQ